MLPLLFPAVWHHSLWLRQAGSVSLCLQSKGYSIDADAWHAAVHHTLPYAKLLKPEPAMRSFLEAIKLPKYIFTNADIKHAEICLQLMGLDNIFDVRLSVSFCNSFVHSAPYLGLQICSQP